MMSNRLLNSDKFLSKSKEKFGDRYDYSDVEYLTMHFKPIDWFGGIVSFELQKKKDEIKNKFCVERGIELLRISYQDNIEKIINNL